MQFDMFGFLIWHDVIRINSVILRVFDRLKECYAIGIIYEMFLMEVFDSKANESNDF